MNCKNTASKLWKNEPWESHKKQLGTCHKINPWGKSAHFSSTERSILGSFVDKKNCDVQKFHHESVRILVGVHHCSKNHFKQFKPSMILPTRTDGLIIDGFLPSLIRSKAPGCWGATFSASALTITCVYLCVYIYGSLPQKSTFFLFLLVFTVF